MKKFSNISNEKINEEPIKIDTKNKLKIDLFKSKVMNLNGTIIINKIIICTNR